MLLIQVQQFETGTKYALDILHKCGKRVKTKIQKVLRANCNVCRNYRAKTGRGPFCPTPSWVGLSISSVNVTKCGHIYWRNPKWKTSFFVPTVYNFTTFECSNETKWIIKSVILLQNNVLGIIVLRQVILSKTLDVANLVFCERFEGVNGNPWRALKWSNKTYFELKFQIQHFIFAWYSIFHTNVLCEYEPM